MPLELRDALLSVSRAMPNGAATVYSDGIDLGHGPHGDFLAQTELLIESPALAVGVLADAATMKYSVQHDTDPAFGTAVTLYADVLVQTGAGGAGAAAASVKVRFPVDVNRYVRVRGIKSGSGDASSSAFTAGLVF